MARPAGPNRFENFPSRRRAWRGKLLHALDRERLEYFPDGLLIVDENGRIEACGDAGRVSAGETPCEQLGPHQLIIPGFVDMHVHLPQIKVTGCQDESLLAWLENWIFQAEARFAESAHARKVSRWFFDELLQNGTTTAAVFLTSHPEATRIAFETAEAAGNRVIMGQNLMDTGAPDALIRPTADLLKETETLCKEWHGHDDGRLQYAWIPRFALTSTEALLKGIGELRAKYPNVYFHTHLSEQQSEIAAVLERFPQASSYTDAYDRFGLLGARSILAHSIHLSDAELDTLGAKQCSLAHCAGSNFFLKSGRFRLFDILARELRFGLGSDVGAGPDLSIFKAMKDTQYMQSDRLVPLATLFYLATLGGAEALMMGDRVGNLLPGKEADFLILDFDARGAIPASALDGRATGESIVSRLVYLGDDRLVQSTFVRGRRVFDRHARHAEPLLQA